MKVYDYNKHRKYIENIFSNYEIFHFAKIIESDHFKKGDIVVAFKKTISMGEMNAAFVLIEGEFTEDSFCDFWYREETDVIEKIDKSEYPEYFI